MSDVNIAPPAPDAGAPPLAPQRTEVPIEQNPVNTPSPVGQQAPPKPEGAEPRAESRREAIQRAFKKAEAEGRPGAARPRMGHNQPPEETPPERKQQPPVERHREQGRFAKAPETGVPGARPGERPGAPQVSGQVRGSTNALPETAPYRAPPSRFAPHAQAEWAAAPESVRGEVYRMHNEVAGMHRHYQADKQVMDTIRQYHQLATQQGTSLQRALHNYTNMENKLRTDVVGGLDLIVDNLNLRTPDGRKLGLRDVAWHILNQTPDQHKQLKTEHMTSAAQHQIGQLHQVVNQLAHSVQTLHHREQFKQTRSAVDQFADSHPRFDELGDLIEAELRTGYDIETAYRRAELLRPNTRAAQTRNPSAQTRSDKSIHGAPSGDSSNESARRRSEKPVGRREAIQRAINRVSGSL